MSKRTAFKQCTSLSEFIDNSLEQQRYSFNDQYLAALLQVYKDYYPDVIISNFRRAKSSVFRVLFPPLKPYLLTYYSTPIQPSKPNSPKSNPGQRPHMKTSHLHVLPKQNVVKLNSFQPYKLSEQQLNPQRLKRLPPSTTLFPDLKKSNFRHRWLQYYKTVDYNSFSFLKLEKLRGED